MIEPGDTVKFQTLPHWVDELSVESQEVFRMCHGRSFLVSEIDANRLCVLDVNDLVDDQFLGFKHDIRLEPEFLSRDES